MYDTCSPTKFDLVHNLLKDICRIAALDGTLEEPRGFLVGTAARLLDELREDLLDTLRHLS